MHHEYCVSVNVHFHIGCFDTKMETKQVNCPEHFSALIVDFWLLLIECVQWKHRWCILQKLSPVSSKCCLIHSYKNYFYSLIYSTSWFSYNENHHLALLHGIFCYISAVYKWFDLLTYPIVGPDAEIHSCSQISF